MTSLKAKGKGKDTKRKSKGKRSESKGRSLTPGRPTSTTRSAYTMPMNRYPVAIGGTHTSLNDKHYSVIFDSCGNKTDETYGDI